MIVMYDGSPDYSPNTTAAGTSNWLGGSALRQKGGWVELWSRVVVQPCSAPRTNGPHGSHRFGLFLYEQPASSPNSVSKLTGSRPIGLSNSMILMYDETSDYSPNTTVADNAEWSDIRARGCDRVQRVWLRCATMFIKYKWRKSERLATWFIQWTVCCPAHFRWLILFAFLVAALNTTRLDWFIVKLKTFGNCWMSLETVPKRSLNLNKFSHISQMIKETNPMVNATQLS